MTIHVMTFEVGAVLQDSQWQAPAYCFSGQDDERAGRSLSKGIIMDPLRRLLQGLERSVGMTSSDSL